jgi:KTSC domain
MRFRVLLICGAIAAVLLAPPSDGDVISRIHRAEVDSSAISSIGYSARLHALEIEFRNGAIYRYLDVPVQTYRELMASPSKASYYDNNIRHHFRSVHIKPRQ